MVQKNYIIILVVLVTLTSKAFGLSGNYSINDEAGHGSPKESRILFILKISSIVCGGLSGILFAVSLVYLLGFRQSGVLQDSLAREYQAMMGNVEKGSCFACCQSAGTTPLGTRVALGFSIFFGCASGVMAGVYFLDKLIGIIINISMICYVIFDFGRFIVVEHWLKQK